MTSDDVKAIKALANEISEELNADIHLISAGIERPIGRKVINLCRNRRRKPNALLILVTDGGSADAAYRISRCYQDNYQRFTCLIPGICKSAGTIIACGAHELAMGDQGELGPLDIQLRKADELWEYKSGLTAMDALTFLQQQAFLAFERYMLDLKGKSQGQITLKTAAEIAGSLSTGLYGHIYAQIDPMQLGENTRSMNISKEYGERLGKKGKNLKSETVSTLAASYPSHGFVIDLPEAQSLFQNVRGLSVKEQELIELLEDLAYEENAEESFCGILNSEPPASASVATISEEKQNEQELDNHTEHGEHRGGSKKKAGRTSETVSVQESASGNGSPAECATKPPM